MYISLIETLFITDWWPTSGRHIYIYIYDCVQQSLQGSLGKCCGAPAGWKNTGRALEGAPKGNKSLVRIHSEGNCKNTCTPEGYRKGTRRGPEQNLYGSQAPGGPVPFATSYVSLAREWPSCGASERGHGGDCWRCLPFDIPFCTADLVSQICTFCLHCGLGLTDGLSRATCNSLRGGGPGLWTVNVLGRSFYKGGLHSLQDSHGAGILEPFGDPNGS